MLFRSGITFSGGEPTLQSEALIPLFDRLHAENIHICLDTNGNNFNEQTRELYKRTDLVLLDVKQINNERHKVITGHPNAQTLKTADWLEEQGIPMRIRYVLVPGYSDSEEDIRAFGAHFKHYKHIERIELLPYHTFGVHKYESMGKQYPLQDVKEDRLERILEVRSWFAEYFPNVWTQ